MTTDTSALSVTIKDVAARAGVSPATVSNVLNRPHRVAARTRARVLSAIDETGFIRNGSASRLRSLNNTAIGLVVIDVANPFFGELSRGVQRVAEERGYVVMLCDSDSSLARERRHLDYLEEQRVAGVLATPSSYAAIEGRLDRLRQRGTSIVLVDEPSDDPRQCSVTVDDVRGGELAGEHLLALGRTRLAYLTSVHQFRQFDDRLRGLRRAIARSEVAARVTLDIFTVETLESSAVVDATARLLDARVDAVFCANDVAALSLLRDLTERQIDIPGEIAIIGYDDITFASLAMIPLSSIRQPARLLGSTAAELLIEECGRGPHEHRHVVFEPELVARASTLGTR